MLSVEKERRRGKGERGGERGKKEEKKVAENGEAKQEQRTI